MARRLRVMGIPEGPVADDTETDSRSLYICTYESKTGHAHYDIRAIRLSDLLSTFKSKSKIELPRKLASVEGKDVPYLMGCGLLGSQILLAGGLEPRDPKQKTGLRYGPYGSKQIYLFETDDDGKRREKVVYNHGHGHSHSHTTSDEGEFGRIIKGDCCYGELHQGKPEPLVVEVGGISHNSMVDQNDHHTQQKPENGQHTHAMTAAMLQRSQRHIQHKDKHIPYSYPMSHHQGSLS